MHLLEKLLETLKSETGASPARNQRAALIVLEGPNEVGKTTQAEALASRLRSDGYAVLQVAEPATRHWAELLNSDAVPVSEKHAMTDYYRELHISMVIEPALKEGFVVVLDRYWLSTVVYQARPWSLYKRLARFSAHRYLSPDLWLVFHHSSPTTLRSRWKESKPDLSFVKQELERYKRASAFIETLGERVQRIDASERPQVVFSRVYEAVKESLIHGFSSAGETGSDTP